ncbi:hypothetical protein KKG65_01835 [Patescibacteria group bacterium]|nr:hypothetical protein [Patescibacteria group bacterium]
MEGESNLQAFSVEQLSTTEKILPSKIAEITHDIEAGERRKLDVVLENVSEAAKNVSGKTQEKFAFMGSMGMYALLNELKQDDSKIGDLMLLEQRIAGGKNDFDICVEEDKKQKVMQEFGWGEKEQELSRGYVGLGKQMVDFLVRQENSDFPWQAVVLEGKTIYVQNPEEMIFEKMGALIDPGLDEGGEQKKAEVKWGVDIKILKTYLLVKKGFTFEQLDTYLADKWKVYAEAKRYGSVMQLAENFGLTETVKDLVKPVLEKALRRESNDVRADLIAYAGEGSEQIVDTLLAVTDKASFVESMKVFVDHKMGKLDTYEEAQAKANLQYKEILVVG